MTKRFTNLSPAAQAAKAARRVRLFAAAGALTTEVVMTGFIMPTASNGK